MAQYINTNILALNAQRNLAIGNANLASSVEKLSSGLRINSAADDAAGLAITTRMTSRIQGMEQAKRNANDAISMVQVAEGAMGEQISMLQRMRTLAVQSANGILSSSDREKLDNEMKALNSEIDRVANTTQFNGEKLLDGKNRISVDGTDFQVGEQAGQTLSVKTTDSTIKGLKLDTYNEIKGNASTADISNATNAENFYIEVDKDGDGTADIISSKISIDADSSRTSFGKAQEIVDAINKETSVTGVVALLDKYDNSGTMQYGVSLRTAGGNDITITSDGGGTVVTSPGDLGLSDTGSTAATDGFIDISTQDGAKTAILQIDNALDKVLSSRSDMGVYQNRFEATISNLSSSSQGMQAARGRIQDTDFAIETANLTKNQIITQAATAMLAQANQIPQNVLTLLR